MRSLQLVELTHECVKLGVGDLWVVEDVVAFFVVADTLAEVFDLLGARGHEEVVIRKTDYLSRART